MNKVISFTKKLLLLISAVCIFQFTSCKKIVDTPEKTKDDGKAHLQFSVEKETRTVMGDYSSITLDDFNMVVLMYYEESTGTTDTLFYSSMNEFMEDDIALTPGNYQFVLGCYKDSLLFASYKTQEITAGVNLLTFVLEPDNVNPGEEICSFTYTLYYPATVTAQNVSVDVTSGSTTVLSTNILNEQNVVIENDVTSEYNGMKKLVITDSEHCPEGVYLMTVVLTTTEGTQGTWLGTLFCVKDFPSSGSGVIKSFSRQYTNTYYIQEQQPDGTLTDSSDLVRTQTYTKYTGYNLLSSTEIYSWHYALDWFTDSSYETPAQNGAPFVATGDNTFYGKWRLKNTYTITFDMNGGQGTVPEPVQKEEGSSVNLDFFDVPSDSPYFTVWELSEEDEARLLSSSYSSSFKIFEDITVYAAYSENMATITFNSNGGSEIQPLVVPVGRWVSASSFEVPVREGYILTGWETIMNGQNEIITSNISFTAFTREFTAIWAPAAKLTYHYINGPDNDDTSVLLFKKGSTINRNYYVSYSDEEYPSPQNSDGYAFYGWYESPLLTGDRFNSNNLTINDDIDVYAKWVEGHTVTVLYSEEDPVVKGTYVVPSGAIFDTSSYKYYTGQEYVNVNIKRIEKAGYRLAEVYKKGEDGISDIYEPAITEDTTVYCRWSQTVIIRMNLQYPGSPVLTDNATIRSYFDFTFVYTIWYESFTGTHQGYSPTIPNRPGYTLAGFYYDEECTDSNICNSENVITEEKFTSYSATGIPIVDVYAKWIPE